ncbi:MAG: hypothetical protein FJ161_03380 [Gammaproteobacteria bacterium]|nr:hypothetical protein [Gammaproteobacteria bacterium]
MDVNEKEFWTDLLIQYLELPYLDRIYAAKFDRNDPNRDRNKEMIYDDGLLAEAYSQLYNILNGDTAIAPFNPENILINWIVNKRLEILNTKYNQIPLFTRIMSMFFTYPNIQKIKAERYCLKNLQIELIDSRFVRNAHPKAHNVHQAYHNNPYEAIVMIQSVPLEALSKYYQKEKKELEEQKEKNRLEKFPNTSNTSKESRAEFSTITQLRQQRAEKAKRAATLMSHNASDSLHQKNNKDSSAPHQ